MNKKTISILALSTMPVLGLLGGCQRESGAGTRGDQRNTPSTPTVPDRTTGSGYGKGSTSVDGEGHVVAKNNDQAITQIAQARCARERSCGNIGAGKRWAADANCQTDLVGKTRDDLNLKECPGGIDQKELSECLDSIHKESCGNPLETLSRMAACRSSDMCKALPR